MIAKEIITVAENIVRVTVADERWYAKAILSRETGLPEYRFVPSITWIASHYPKGIGFYKWLAQHGWDESQVIKQAAADKGSKIHQACAVLIDGTTLTWRESTFVNPSTGQPEPLTVEEWEAVASFVAWVAAMRDAHGPHETIARDFVVFSEEHNCAGTLDWLVRFPRAAKTLLIDFKSGQHVWPEYEIQLSAYKRSLPQTLLVPAGLTGDDVELGVLQLGYQRNKLRYRLTPVADQWDLFLAAKTIWAKEQAGVDVFKAEYPMTLSLVPPEPPPPAPEPSAPKNGRAKKTLAL
jgi:hypothetical protein